MTLCKALLAAAVAAALLTPAATTAEAATRKPTLKIKVHPKRWHGYGFLPGYHPQPSNLDLRRRSTQRDRNEPRYWHNGQITYGWGYPGFYRGRWNGGSFGPCWTYTPIGMMPTCGQ